MPGSREKIIVSIPRLTANAQACKDFIVILDEGEMLLTFALVPWSGSAETFTLL